MEDEQLVEDVEEIETQPEEVVSLEEGESNEAAADVEEQVESTEKKTELSEEAPTQAPEAVEVGADCPNCLATGLLNADTLCPNCQGTGKVTL